MDWKKEAVADLGCHEQRKAALLSLGEEIRELRARAYGTGSARPRASAVRAGGRPAEERLIAMIDELDRKEENYRLTRRRVEAVERGLACVSPQQRQILEQFYVRRTAAHAQDLAQLLHVVVQVGVSSHEASLETETDDKQYIRTGKVTTKTGAQRTFSISGDRYHGDAFQDWALSLPVLFGHGAKVTAEYVYFSILTGKGEKGKVAVVVQEDQTGDAGENAGFSVDLMGQGSPEEYTYSAD